MADSRLLIANRESHVAECPVPALQARAQDALIARYAICHSPSAICDQLFATKALRLNR